VVSQIKEKVAEKFKRQAASKIAVDFKKNEIYALMDAVVMR